jgi:hypothetical protein
MNSSNKKKITIFGIKIFIMIIISIIIGYGVNYGKDDIWKVRINATPNTSLMYELGMADVILKRLLVKPDPSTGTYRIIASNLMPVKFKVTEKYSYISQLDLSENLIFMEFKNKEASSVNIDEIINFINQEIRKIINKANEKHYKIATEKKINFNKMKINKLESLLKTYETEKNDQKYETLNNDDVGMIAESILNSIEGSNKANLIDRNYSKFFEDFSKKYSVLLFSHRPNIEIALEQLETFDPEKEDFMIMELKRIMQNTQSEEFFNDYGIQRTLYNKPSLYITVFGIFIIIFIINFLVTFLYKKILPKHLKRKINFLLDLT